MAGLEPEKAPPISVIAGEKMMKSAELQLMTPLLNFLQLLCENHNIKLQVRGDGGLRGGGLEDGLGRGVGTGEWGWGREELRGGKRGTCWE